MARAKISKALKQQVIDRANGSCEFCLAQLRFSPNSFHIEHHVPLSREGTNTAENLTLACPQCNLHKATKIDAIDPVSEQLVKIFNPRQMIWGDHFTWSDDTIQMLGTTPIGRATIALLQTNRENMLNLRWVLRQQGFHPPD
jgi:5-methylcytosine-specific restriction endonuclease McrA